MAPQHPPTGQLVDVDGHRLHLYCRGEGSPTVVFEAGGAGWSLDWHLVQDEVARFTRTCAYDRAGFGWSEPGPKPRSAARIAGELHSLLAAAGIPAPYILVGASFGGHPARLFASDYRPDVAGMVLLDARHEDFVQMIPAWRTIEAAGKGMYQFLLFAASSGLLDKFGRLAGERAIPPVVSKLPPELRPVYLEVGFQPNFFQANLDELAASAESDQQLRTAGDLGDLPLTVIRHGIPDLFSRLPAGKARAAEETWQGLQASLAGLSTHSRLLVAERSGHAIQVDQPELVVEAIRAMVEEVRSLP